MGADIFYGAGCANPERNKIVELSLNAQFRTPVTINSDLLGSARGLFGTESGMACILGSGSNSCLFDGESIVANVRSGGFILGDEGSGGALGRQFASDCLKGIAPKDLVEEFLMNTSSAKIVWLMLYTHFRMSTARCRPMLFFWQNM